MNRTPEPPSQPGGRIVALDTFRGFTILSMVAFHTTYDLAYIYGMNMTWFTDGIFQEVWRSSISWVFLMLAGWMTALSRNNVKRGVVYAISAIAVWAATSIAAVDTPVTFGILFCMAASTLLWAAIERIGGNRLDRVPYAAVVLLALAFVMTRGVPHVRYAISGLAWFGFPSPDFASGDYYPLIPFALLYFSSACAARRWKVAGKPCPAWARRDWCKPLSVIGRYSLPIYLLHQPIVLVVLNAALD